MFIMHNQKQNTTPDCSKNNISTTQEKNKRIKKYNILKAI